MPVPLREFMQAVPQALLVGDDPPLAPLGGAVLTNDGTGPSLGGPEACLAAIHRSPTTLGA